MRKKSQTPLTLQIIRWIFPKLERLAPVMAQRYFIKLFFTPFRYRQPQKEDAFFESAAKSSLMMGSKRIQVYSWGKEGDPFVLVMHGWAGRATQFRKFIPPLLQNGYRVVGIDGPSHGKSDGRQTNILEFDEAFRLLLKKEGNPVAAIAHSFGGVALLYAITQGLSITRLINIASPTIGDEVIGTYLKAINGSKATGNRFKEWMKVTYGKSFDEFSGLHLIAQLQTPLELLLIYDENDPEVPIVHAEELLKVYPTAKLLRTQGLGHNRLLKDDLVIGRTMDFIRKGQ